MIRRTRKPQNRENEVIPLWKKNPGWKILFFLGEILILVNRFLKIFGFCDFSKDSFVNRIRFTKESLLKSQNPKIFRNRFTKIKISPRKNNIFHPGFFFHKGMTSFSRFWGFRVRRIISTATAWVWVQKLRISGLTHVYTIGSSYM